MKIISSTQLKELDKYTIAKEPVASIDLMERAAEELTRAITHRWDTSSILQYSPDREIMGAMRLP